MPVTSPDEVVDAVVISSPFDLHGDKVCAALDLLGAKVLRISLNNLHAHSFAWEPQEQMTIGDGGPLRALPTGTPAYFRRPGLPEPDIEDAQERVAVVEEIEDVFYGLLSGLELRWLDSPRQIWEAERKLWQLTAVAGAGLATPMSISTNQPRVARSFLEEGPVIVKPVGPGTIEAPSGRKVFFASEFTPELIDVVAACPVLLQRRIEGFADARVITVGPRAFLSRRERRPIDAIDWRESDPEGSGFRAFEDASLALAALRAAKALGLRLTAQDWILTDDGPVFLEANPAGQWLFLEQQLADRITRSIAVEVLRAS